MVKNTGNEPEVEMTITPTIRTKATRNDPPRTNLRDASGHKCSFLLGRRTAAIIRRNEAIKMPRLPMVTAEFGVSVEPSEGVTAHWATIRRTPLTIGAVPRRSILNEPDMKYALAENNRK